MTAKSENGNHLGIKKLRNAALAVLIAGSATAFHDHKPQPELFGRESSDLCAFASIPVVFETSYNAEAEKQIKEYLARLPASAFNALGRDSYRIIMVENTKAVQNKRWLGWLDRNKDVGGYADPLKREIVIDTSVNFPHELAHAIDFVFGDLSMSEDFIKVSGSFAKKNKDDIFENNRKLIELKKQIDDKDAKEALNSALSNSDKNIESISRLQNYLNLPYPLSKSAIYLDLEAKSYIRHIFVNGFESYYSSDEQVKERFKDKFPAIYEFFDRFDKKLRRFC